MVEGDGGVNANYLSHPSNSVISPGLAIGFTDTVVIISGNRATDTPVHPNFCTVLFALARPLTYTFLYPLSRIISLCTNVPI